MNRLVTAALNDFKLVFRDHSLKVFLALPLITLPVIRYGVPYVAGVYNVVQDYIAVILMLATMQGPVAFGFIYSMVLVDEKDTNVGKVYGVLPVSKFWLTVVRLLPPYALATFATFLLLLAEPFYGLPALSIFVYSVVAASAAPLMIMFVAIAASNKIEAMTWLKLFNVPLYLPIVSFFVPASFSLLFAVFPPYWAYHTFDSIIRGDTFWAYSIAGLLHSVAATGLMTKKFARDHFR
jgi:fluoroquinolone transport system permease protein